LITGPGRTHSGTSLLTIISTNNTVKASLGFTIDTLLRSALPALPASPHYSALHCRFVFNVPFQKEHFPRFFLAAFRVESGYPENRNVEFDTTGWVIPSQLSVCARMDFLAALAQAAEMMDYVSHSDSGASSGPPQSGKMTTGSIKPYSSGTSEGANTPGSNRHARGHRRTRKASNTVHMDRRKRFVFAEPEFQLTLHLQMDEEEDIEENEEEEEHHEQELIIEPVSILRKSKTFLRPKDIPIFPARTAPRKCVTFLDQVEEHMCPMDEESKRLRVSYFKIPEYSRNRNATVRAQVEEEISLALI